MGCGGSKAVEVVAPPAPSEDELRLRATKTPLPKAHEELTKLINLLDAGAPDEIQKWLTLIDETRSRRKAVEEASKMAFDEFRAWVAHVESCVRNGITNVAALEEAWQVATDATIAKGKIVADGAKLPLPADHKEFAELVALLLARDAAATQAWLTLIDETRSRRKAVEEAALVSFADLRAQVAVVEVLLSKGIVQDEYLAKAWQPLPRGHAELPRLLEALRTAGSDTGSEAASAEGAHPAEVRPPTHEYLRLVEHERARKAAVEASVATAGIEWAAWVRAIDGCCAAGVVSVEVLERLWSPRGGTDAEDAAVATKAATRSGADNVLYERARAPPGEMIGHEWEGQNELDGLLTELMKRDAAATQAWLTLVDETRLRRKAIEKAAGLPYAEFREWVEGVHEALAKEVVNVGPLQRAWKVGKYI